MSLSLWTRWGEGASWPECWLACSNRNCVERGGQKLKNCVDTKWGKNCKTECGMAGVKTKMTLKMCGMGGFLAQKNRCSATILAASTRNVWNGFFSVTPFTQKLYGATQKCVEWKVTQCWSCWIFIFEHANPLYSWDSPPPPGSLWNRWSIYKMKYDPMSIIGL